MDEEAARAAKAERIKALLAGYYGAPGQEAGGQPGTAPGAGGAAQLGRPSQHPAMPVTVDSPGFDATSHITNLLRNSTLERLMVEHRSTAREIKNLDTDMQQLVYENYNKFISATDTIRTMKGQVDGALPELEKLKTIMGSVAEKSNRVSTKLQTRQEQMEELHRVQALLRKLQAVFDLPKRMRAALEEDVLDTAVSFYAEAQPLLRKYGGRGGATFRQIAADSDQVAKEISQVLKRRLAERKDDTEQCVLLLRKLGEPDDTLVDRYLSGRASRLRRVLSDAAAVVDAMAIAAASPSGALSPEAQSAAKAAKAQLEAPGSWGFTDGGSGQGAEQGAGGPAGAMAPQLRGFVRALDERLINAVQETAVNVTRFFLPQDLDAESAAAKRRPLVALSREAFADYFRIVRRAVADNVVAVVYRAARLGQMGSAGERDLQLDAQALEFGNDWGADTLAQALSTLSADLGIVSGGLPELGLKDRAAELVAGAVTHHIDTCFAALRARLLGAVGIVRARLAEQAAGGLGNQGDSNGGAGGGGSGMLLRRGHAYITELLARGLAALMQGLRAYESHPRLLAPWHARFLDTVQGALQSLFLDLMISLLELCGVKYDGSDLLREALRSSSATTSNSTSDSAAAAAQAAGQQGAGSTGGAGAPESGNSLWTLSAAVAPLEAMAASAATLAGLSQGGSRSTGGSGLIGHGGGGGAGSATDASRSGLLLLLAKLCLFMEQQSVPWVMEALAGAFVPRGPGAGGMGAGGAGAGMQGGRASDQPPAFVPGEVARRLSAASSALLAAYVELHGRQLSLMVRRSVAATNWLQHKEPRGPRPVCDLLSERIGRAEAEVQQLVEDGGRRDVGPSGTSALAKNERGFDAGLLLEAGNVERNLAKIFREKVKIFGGPVQFTQASILSGIAGIGLKSLVECIRLQTLSRAGLQQLQLDCHYLRPLLRRSTGGRAQQVVDSLLDEVVSAGVERSIDPTLLEPAVLDKCLAALEG